MSRVGNFINEKIINKFKIISNLKIKLSLFISIIGLLFLIVGSSYAILQYNEESTNKQIINVGKVKLVLTEVNGGINFENLTTMTDEEGFTQQDYYSFSVSNVGDTPAEYDLLLVTDETKTNTLDKKYIKVGLEVNGEKFDAINLENVNDIIHNTVINTNQNIIYNLRIWIDPSAIEDVTLSDNISLNLKLKVNATQYLGETYSTDILYNKIKNEVKVSNISYKYINGANKTVDGITYNVDDNGVFLYNGTDDNEGSYPIYYYRGNVDNNNVLFGGFCWKIVRTTSTGGTKLIYNGVFSDGSCNNTGTASQLSSTSTFNEKYTSPADVGYMYGTRYTYSTKSMDSVTDTYMYGNDVTYDEDEGTYTLSGRTKTSTSWADDRTTLANGYHYTCFNSTGTCTSIYYVKYFGNETYIYYLRFTGGDTLETVKTKMFTNTTNSTIKTIIDTWYGDNLIDYTSYLENTVFCYDRNFASGTTGGPVSSKDTNSTGYSYFAGYERIAVTYSPSLQCKNQNDRFSLNAENGGSLGFGNNTLTYPIGLLTSDEAVIAGGRSLNNSNYYLTTGEDFWLGTPGVRFAASAANIRIQSTGYIAYGGYVQTAYGVRPVISLKANTQVIKGTGLVTDPYVITE